ncbi:TetR/AcrR family transcriptional regulator [Amycolatopsis sp. NPDC088138]|uniref:TetR/AcrR family transcriptional regulator n=1 Tax=Amycolatopsis sp. NPDC088138 TaxID=3363938 RepID=UPI003812F072
MPQSKPRRSPKPQERQRDPERTRRLIVDAAVAEFAQHGYAGARTSTIAARAGVNQQLISYYFDGKEGLYQAISERWREREGELLHEKGSLAEQIRLYALEALKNPEGVRLMAWGGLEYSGPETDYDHAPRSERLQRNVDQFRALQAEGKLAPEVDPACLTIMLMGAAMATTTLPHVIEGLCRADPRSPEFIEHYAEQMVVLGKLLGLDVVPGEDAPEAKDDEED